MSIFMLADWTLGSPFAALSVSSALCENTVDVRASCLMRREDGAGLWDSFLGNLPQTQGVEAHYF